jgi:serine phosphatase RsbU (regulator of sigma subunit)
MTKKLKLISGVLFFALMSANIGANFYESWAEQFAYSQRGWQAKEVDGKPVIWTVDADGPAAALRVGDEAVSLDVEPPGACRLINRRECAAPPGAIYKLTVRRGGRTLEFDLATAAKPLSDCFFGFIFNLAGLIFPVTGFAVFLLKPDDKQALLLAFMLGSFAGLFGGDIALAPAWLQFSHIKSNMIKDEMEALQELKATLLMPLYSKDGMLGVISLGPRLSDLPFSREDKQLLMSVSGPTALAIENARLVEQMVAEARHLQEIEGDHRRKTEELAFARQLQLSMLPTRNVSLDNVEIVGQMRAATEVGGDYYDFIEMADGRVCVAVGDATGHGMAAGLVVGMVKMGLIHALQGGLQRMNGQASVKPLIEDLNRSLRRSLSQRGMGMCLGAAILDASTLKVEVVSNGMPAPYHYRAASRSLSVIETQAPPLGFLRQVNVRPVETRLGPGDALIWLSDGFEERMNHANQIWGSEQVQRTLERICGEETSAEDIARRMIEACDGAAGGRSNDDDMTIVVARVRLR